MLQMEVVERILQFLMFQLQDLSLKEFVPRFKYHFDRWTFNFGLWTFKDHRFGLYSIIQTLFKKFKDQMNILKVGTKIKQSLKFIDQNETF